jgi:hypothetical protein
MTRPEEKGYELIRDPSGDFVLGSRPAWVLEKRP